MIINQLKKIQIKKLKFQRNPKENSNQKNPKQIEKQRKI